MAADEAAKGVRVVLLGVDASGRVNLRHVDLHRTKIVGRQDAVRPRALSRDVQVHVNAVTVLHRRKEEWYKERFACVRSLRGGVSGSATFFWTEQPEVLEFPRI